MNIPFLKRHTARKNIHAEKRVNVINLKKSNTKMEKTQKMQIKGEIKKCK